jgi:bidirectional [NiFe] hydrogenase diaphorase subunit
MSEYVTLTIDGAQVRAPKGTSVLDAALDYGICIPNLCHVRGLTPIGACRLCVVEVVSGEKTRFSSSCTLEVQEGMKVRAHSPRVMKVRKMVAELLVAEAPNSRAIQDVALRCGVKKVRFPFRNKDCILCGRCVRVCTEAWQARALGFVGRGKDRHVALPFDKRPEYCKRCWSCSELCPMTITPCPGPMKKGEERLCGGCESQLSMVQNISDTCVWCNLGKGFNCVRQAPMGK